MPDHWEHLPGLPQRRGHDKVGTGGAAVRAELPAEDSELAQGQQQKGAWPSPQEA